MKLTKEQYQLVKEGNIYIRSYLMIPEGDFIIVDNEKIAVITDIKHISISVDALSHFDFKFNTINLISDKEIKEKFNSSTIEFTKITQIVEIKEPKTIDLLRIEGNKNEK